MSRGSVVDRPAGPLEGTLTWGVVCGLRAVDELLTPVHWDAWLRRFFATYLTDALGTPIPFAAHHAALWAWVWALVRGTRPPPFVAIWPRGGAKSTSAELACAVVAARETRRYALYVCETQAQADDHVQNVASLLESTELGRAYPQVATRLVGKYGNSLGWRRNRLRTASGFTLDAIGLDSAARGAKVEEDRPDFLILDDLDGELDSAATTEKKLTTLTRKLLPAGAADLAVLAVQNLVLPDGIFARLADGRADFLADRLVSGPCPALDGLAYEQRDGRYVLTAGTPTWDGQDLARCQALVDDIGLSAFLVEAQHEVDAPPGGMFDHLEFRHCAWADVPDLVRIVGWADPAVTDTDQSDAHGIQFDGIATNGDIYRLWSWEARTSPEDCLRRALLKAVELGAEAVGVETDQGGDTWQSVFLRAWQQLVEDPAVAQITDQTRCPQFRAEKAGAGHGPKAHRASQMLTDYEHGQIVHVLGTHQLLERALRRFPRTKPFDLTDASYWSWQDLRRGGAGVWWL